jgi:hypothetical protein
MRTKDNSQEGSDTKLRTAGNEPEKVSEEDLAELLMDIKKNIQDIARDYLRGLKKFNNDNNRRTP